MGKNELQVTLETPPTHIYRPGDVVIGNVATNLDPKVKLSGGITITLYGYAYVSWEEGTGDGKTSYSASEDFFKIPQVLSLSTHQTVYPFSIRIPGDAPKCLPWSVKTPHGKIEYGVEAHVEQPLFHFDKRDNATFILNTFVDSTALSADNPLLSKILTSNSQKTKVGCCCFPFCCWYFCCVKEKVRLTLAHESIVAIPGEEVAYTLEVDNSSTTRHLRNAKIQLIGVWTHISQSSRSRSFNVLHEETLEMSVPPRDQFMKQGKIILPKEMMPTQVTCEVLTLTYTLKASLDKISGFRCFPVPATVETDILIGTSQDEDISLECC